MGVICYASEVMGYNRRRSGLSNAALHMKQDINSIEKNTLPSISISVVDVPIVEPHAQSFLTTNSCMGSPLCLANSRTKNAVVPLVAYLVDYRLW